MAIGLEKNTVGQRRFERYGIVANLASARDIYRDGYLSVQGTRCRRDNRSSMKRDAYGLRHSERVLMVISRNCRSARGASAYHSG